LLPSFFSYSFSPKGTSKASQWVDEAGNIKWPKNDGFAGTSENITLKPGTRIDRYGYEGGTFVSPEGQRDRFVVLR